MPFRNSMAQRTASNHTAKPNEDAVAGPLNDAAMMQSDSWIDQVAAESAQPSERPLLVGTGNLAVSGYIRRRNGCEFSGLGHGCPSQHARLAHLPMGLGGVSSLDDDCSTA
jgi:hypothetical protein